MTRISSSGGMISRLLGRFRRPPETWTPGETTRLPARAVRIPWSGQPLLLTLGEGPGKKLLLCRETLLTRDAPPHRLLILDADRHFQGISGLLRLEAGQSVVLGNSHADQQRFFQFPPTLNNRHLSVSHQGDALVLKDLGSDQGSFLESPPTDLCPGRNLARRMGKLQKIREIYGGPLEPLPAHEALDLLLRVNAILDRETHRLRNARGRPGSLVLLPKEITPIFMGDLHARVDNLLNILTVNGFLDEMETGHAALILLGDAVHPEEDDALSDMESSLLMMDLIFRLKVRFPDRLYYLLGNHDGFSREIVKGGVAQGLVWEKFLRQRRGEAYVAEMVRFYDHLPISALSDDFFACHAGPPHGKLNLSRLIEVRREPELVRQMIWNRLATAQKPGGYTEKDVHDLKKALYLPEEAAFVVGHNPLDPDASVWLDAGGIAHHHILFSCRGLNVAALTRVGGGITLFQYPSEPLLPLINGLEEKT